eukprot:CAMPEP_0174254202 /NCGR_PEP_ID=MMETSP0439-20130205/3548_1 /TAXON_ID=0 /ORGANISM="Stereomyxa ramosa, Strain Chinc5" /LENGTH=108 /DNA_ID=CAMNT_0015335661 /DNA_START=105 /DNA_END=428 /DNA_ORIENTATION=-
MDSFQADLYRAVQSRDIERVCKLLGDSQTIDFHPDTLVRAAQKGNFGIFIGLVSLGAPIDQVNHCGDTPLHWACQVGNVDIVKELLRRGAKVNTINHSGDTPLICAAW